MVNVYGSLALSARKLGSKVLDTGLEFHPLVLAASTLARIDAVERGVDKIKERTRKNINNLGETVSDFRQLGYSGLRMYGKSSFINGGRSVEEYFPDSLSTEDYRLASDVLAWAVQRGSFTTDQAGIVWRRLERELD